jgi:hypothetical protein
VPGRGRICRQSVVRAERLALPGPNFSEANLRHHNRPGDILTVIDAEYVAQFVWGDTAQVKIEHRASIL